MESSPLANYERGAYEPSDEVRVFDGAEDEDDVEGSRLPLLIVLALLVLAMFGGVVWLAYAQGVARGRGETPVLLAASGPERVAPAQPGGANVPYQGFKIYEQPAPSDDKAEDKADDAAPAPPAAKPAPVTPTPVAAAPAPVVQPASKPAAVVEKPVPPPPALKPTVKTVAAAPPAVTRPAPKAAAAPPKSVASLIQQDSMASAPAAKSAPAPVITAPASGAPRQLGQPVAAAPAPVKAAPAAKGLGGYVLQIGAYKSQADADAAWKSYKAKHAALLSGYGPDVQQADLGEKGTWYRLRIAGLADREGAGALCDRLKADGGVCIPVK